MKCTRMQTCNKCKGKDHLLLHQDNYQNKNQGQNQGQQKAKTDAKPASVAQMSAQKDSAKTGQPAPANSAGKDQRVTVNLARYLGSSVVGDDNISLHTIPIFVCTDNGNETLVTALLDDGAQCSVVTQELADCLCRDFSIGVGIDSIVMDGRGSRDAAMAIHG